MSLPLIVHSKLFWYYNGNINSCWYLGLGDGTSVAKQNAYMDDMDRFGIDTITINLCNEEISSPFVGEFMRSDLDNRKVGMLCDFIVRLKQRGKNVIVVYFDSPPSDNPKYPFWCYLDRIPDFLEICTKYLSPIVDGFMLGIESNRGPLSIELVEYGIAHIQKFAVRDGVKLPVGTHEQNVSRNSNGKLYFTRRVPRTADFVGYETMNHPFKNSRGMISLEKGGEVSITDMVEEVTFLANNSGGKVVWVIESNSKEDDFAKQQNNALAAIPGVVGVGGPM